MKKQEKITAENCNKQEPILDAPSDTSITAGTEGMEADTKEEEAESEPEVQLSIVIPYRKDKAQGQELLFALRSWEQHFVTRCRTNMVIIGDKEDWFDEEQICYIPFSNPSDNPQENIMEALRIAVASDEVAETFIWSNDDIYLWNVVALEHIAVPKHTGPLEPNNYSSLYKENMQRTIRFLNGCGIENPLNFGTHSPFLLEKSRIVRILEDHPELMKEGYLWASIYFNLSALNPIRIDWQHDDWCVSIVSSNPATDRFERYTRGKCFLNNSVSGYSPFLERILAKRFPDKSCFEK